MLKLGLVAFHNSILGYNEAIDIIAIFLYIIILFKSWSLFFSSTASFIGVISGLVYYYQNSRIYENQDEQKTTNRNKTLKKIVDSQITYVLTIITLQGMNLFSCSC